MTGRMGPTRAGTVDCRPGQRFPSQEVIHRSRPLSSATLISSFPYTQVAEQFNHLMIDSAVGETLSARWMADPFVGDRPPFAPLHVWLAIRHSRELCCGVGLFMRRAAW